MAQFPDAGVMTDQGQTSPTITVQDFKLMLRSLVLAARQLPGAMEESRLTVTSGSIAPDRAHHRVDTEGAAASDMLERIGLETLPDGSLLHLRAEDPARAVTVRHGAGGNGEILLLGGSDLGLSTALPLVLQRRGTVWSEAGLLHSHAWTDISGRPATFPPSAHQHTGADMPGPVTWGSAMQYATTTVNAPGAAYTWSPVTEPNLELTGLDANLVVTVDIPVGAAHQSMPFYLLIENPGAKTVAWTAPGWTIAWAGGAMPDLTREWVRLGGMVSGGRIVLFEVGGA